ncbi:hypothetical protein [Paraburkholderia sp. SIMBA_054]|uniref:hypothetical protein n=1 Tax=Paraburkholderia sp. SIMBA_054 TaxID=3085795 RepID=UPI00397900EB
MSDITEEIPEGMQVEEHQPNIEYVVADAAGQIQYYASVPPFMLESQTVPAGCELVEGVGQAETHYVSNHVVVERPVSSATLDGMTLRTLPVPCTITIGSTAHACTDDHCELEFSLPGSYVVVVSAFPMLDATFEVTQP